MGDEYVLKLRLLTSGFKSALKSTSLEAKKAGEEMKKSTTISPSASLAVIGIAGAFALLASATGKYINSDKKLQDEMKLTKKVIDNMVAALGQALAPAIKGVINVAEYGIIILAKLIELFTGFNALENLNNEELDKTTKKAKAAAKSLAGFDTLTTLSTSSGTGGGSKDLGISKDALEEFKKKIAEVDKIFKDYETDIRAATDMFLGFIGVSMISKIASFIGVGGTAGAAGTGLMGIASALGWIAALAVLSVEIFLILKGYEEWKQFKKDMEEHNKNMQENNKLHSTKVTELGDKYIELANKQKRTKEEEQQLITIRESMLQLSDNQTRSYKNETDQLLNLIKSTGPWSKATKEQVKVLETLIDKGTSEAKTMEEIATTTDLSKEEADKYIKSLEEQIRQANGAASAIKTMGGDYEKATENVDAMRESLGKIKAKYTADVDIKANTKDAEKSMSNFITKIMNSGLGKIPVFSSIKNLFKFDVGTNYVPQDQVAVVHKGEMIVPKKYNPSTSGIGGTNEETNALLRQLNSTLEQKQFNGYISASDITNAAINGINQQSRIMGRSVIK